MDLRTFAGAIFIALLFPAWPNLSKALGISGGLVAVVVVAVALVVLVAMSFKDLPGFISMPPRAASVLFAVAILNGGAVWVQAILTADTKVPTGLFLATTMALQVCFAPFMDWFVNGAEAAPTTRQLVCYAVIVVCIIVAGHK